ncbi:divalent-cation tolerance protein CutA [Undibacterium cyanobacteriorum]|uniref:Divalent-cation tolerance protein CutA n=1 Tax=Undibacterium cyanobacteriorum TaxID=3073561 RepID=A0ABY9RNH1_9BURK|nr:divalent-cation tolerance protein CutA [Undibacterium sp. 20NA77.5]WMW81835.1 divalent-cation tolerance protein CutA [Undibacterium sp. 20NA77.5]
MTSSTHLAVFTTINNHAVAQAMARSIVERKLAACVQISAIESFYTWNDAVQHDQEFRLVFKTTAVAYQALENAIRELHSYELPAIYALPVERMFEPYQAWVDQMVSKS